MQENVNKNQTFIHIKYTISCPFSTIPIDFRSLVHLSQFLQRTWVQLQQTAINTVDIKGPLKKDLFDCYLKLEVMCLRQTFTAVMISHMWDRNQEQSNVSLVVNIICFFMCLCTSISVILIPEEASNLSIHVRCSSSFHTITHHIITIDIRCQINYVRCAGW